MLYVAKKCEIFITVYTENNWTGYTKKPTIESIIASYKSYVGIQMWHEIEIYYKVESNVLAVHVYYFNVIIMYVSLHNWTIH